MEGVLPSRASDRRKLVLGALLVLGTAVLGLVPVSFGVLGSPWPLGLLWAACGWLSLGPNLSAAGLLLVLGLAMDLLTDAPLGAWAFCGLACYGCGLLQWRYLGRQRPESLLQVLASAGWMALVVAVIGGLTGAWLALGSMVLPLAGAVLSYPLVRSLFVFEETL